MHWRKREKHSCLRRGRAEPTSSGSFETDRRAPLARVAALGAPELWRMARFGVVGVINTAVDIGMFSLLYFVIGVPLLASNSAAYLTAVTGSFFLNKNWTFADARSDGRTGRQYVLFVLLGLGGLALSNFVVWSFSQMVTEIVSKLFAVFALFIWNFSMSRFIVFRPQPQAR